MNKDVDPGITADLCTYHLSLPGQVSICASITCLYEGKMTLRHIDVCVTVMYLGTDTNYGSKEGL
jgi:hypothetical protein